MQEHVTPLAQGCALTPVPDNQRELAGTRLKVPIADIVVADRHRRDLGDIDALAQSIKDLGLLQPVVVTPDMRLVAGARRLEAVKRNGEGEIEITFANNLDEALKLILAERDENTCRLDFSPLEMVSVGRALEPFEREAAKERQGTRRDLEHGEKFTPSSSKAVDRVAAAVGKSRPTYEKAKAVAEAAEAEPELFGPIAEEMDTSRKVDRAFQKMQIVTRRAHIAERAEWPTDKYRVIYADPPWEYGQNYNPNYGHTMAHYPTLNLDQLCALDVESIALPDAVLFLWITSPKLYESGPRILKAWGFDYKASFVWDKVKHNWGHYNSVRHEFLLLCTRGSCPPDVPTLYDSVMTIERSEEHSQKPAEVREMIDTLYPHGPRIELFAREPADGWEAWGNEL